MEDAPRLHDLDAVVERIGICRSEVYKLISTGQLRSVKIGRRRLVSEQAIRDYITQVDQPVA
jgi:excisionase family DNA binding protein